ncbi:NtaA/DmoA family FMN-dependent monooxygenase [Agreia sp. PsM10]|uniref:NtaA/DmoA family FMN-dependent monooxygenase n=1 Tax=Agreia sp. PsM10 TaxID=3030533 RepID=UPI00263BCEC7|nr:NtaA/DmoA family FMN-dependent monooxygenase [Agreia sp. PsM10]MDN4640032.1 NtaA/DmoA family FMN-dependent monooxygenase [Agreia sp. PsM10]
MNAPKMILATSLGTSYGMLTDAWRSPGVDPKNFTSTDAQVRIAQSAERGGFAFLFVPDFAAVQGGEERAGLNMTMDPMLALAAVARETSRIGMVATGSTTFQEPYNLARQFKALDVMSHGRVGWNAVTTSSPAVAANYGQPVAERSARYRRANETVQIVQALWGSWEADAWIGDQATGRYFDPEKVRPIDLQGEFVASRGPLPIPPSEQGQPVIFTAGGPSPHLLSLAGRYASGFIAEVWTIEEARAQRQMVRESARQAGRDPDEIKYFVGIMTTVASTVREGLDRRLAVTGEPSPQRVVGLGQMLGLRLGPDRVNDRLSDEELARAYAAPIDPRSEVALRVARQGWTIRDILAHGVIDFHPTVVGPGALVADHMQEWFEAEAADGFWVIPDLAEAGIDDFVDNVVPILRQRGIYPDGYSGETLRDHLGVPAQYGRDPRLA